MFTRCWPRGRYIRDFVCLRHTNVQHKSIQQNCIQKEYSFHVRVCSFKRLKLNIVCLKHVLLRHVENYLLSVISETIKYIEAIHVFAILVLILIKIRTKKKSLRAIRFPGQLVGRRYLLNSNIL